MNQRPHIEVDRTLRVSDEFAGRIVDLTIQALNYDAAETMAAQTKASAKGLGNPKGQRKYYDAIVKAFGPTVMAKALDYTGKRKHFRFRIDLWGVPDNGVTGLQIGRLTVTGLGPHKLLDIQTMVLCDVSRHALIRIVQRAGFVRPEDLIALLLLAWKPIQLALVAAGDNWGNLPKPEQAGWILPAKTGTGETVYLVVKGSVVETKEPNGLIIVTVLDAGKIKDPSRLDALQGFIAREVDYDRLPALLDALRETTSSLWGVV